MRAGRATAQQQRIARITGVLWIVTFSTSIPAYLLYNPVLDDTGFTFILVGILSMLAMVTLRQDLAGTNTDSATLETVGRSLEAVEEWTFALGPGFVVGVGSGLIMGTLAYRSGLVPRWMAMLGLVGGPLICLTGLAVIRR